MTDTDTPTGPKVDAPKAKGKPFLLYEKLKVAKDTTIRVHGIGKDGVSGDVPIKKGTKIIDLDPAEQMKALVDIDILVPVFKELEEEIDRLSQFHYRCQAAMKTRDSKGLKK